MMQQKTVADQRRDTGGTKPGADSVQIEKPLRSRASYSNQAILRLGPHRVTAESTRGDLSVPQGRCGDRASCSTGGDRDKRRRLPHPSIDSVLSDPGLPLPPALQQEMGQRFGQDFSQVRIHSGSTAEQSARELNADAYTIGEDVVFGAGQFTPTAPKGRRLIAHELAHVGQNRYGETATPTLEPSCSRAEAEAQRAGHRASMGLPTGTLTARNAGVALTPASDRIVPLLSYSAGDWAVTANEERQILALLVADRDVSSTIIDINSARMLSELLERVDEPENRRDLLRLLGARLNPAARAVVEPIIQDLEINDTRYGAQIQYNMGRLGVTSAAAPFNRAAYKDLISGDAMSAFTGSGATGVNPSERGYSDLPRAGTKMFKKHINPLGALGAYLSSLTPDQRRRQAELLVRQPISTVYAESYAGLLPSRLEVMRAAGAAHNIEGSLVAAIILAEQRDQTRVEDARDFIGGLVFGLQTSMGLGQVLPSTARRYDLFADTLTNRTSTFAQTTARGNLHSSDFVWLLVSDETNILAVARYIRMLANTGAAKSITALPNTRAAFPGINLGAYANNSSTWPEDNVGVLGMYYTSRAWTDDVGSRGWGWFVQQAYRDVKSAGIF